MRRGLLLIAALIAAMLALPGATATATTVNGCVIGPGAQCPGANLAGANLSGADLANANLQGANLQGANLDRARLLFANLQGADLTNARLSEAVFPGAQLQGAKLVKVTALRANFTHVHLDGADLTDSKFGSSTFFGSSITNVNLTRANLWGATAGGANFSLSNLTDAVFQDCRCSGASFHSARLVRTQLQASDLTGANLLGAHFSGARFSQAKITGAHVGGSVNASADARYAFFLPVYTHVNAYPPYGKCTVTDADTRCEGRNDDPKATPGLQDKVDFIWDNQSPRRFRITGHLFDTLADREGVVSMAGTVSNNLGAFHVTSGLGLDWYYPSHTGTDDNHGGQAGGPLLMIVNRAGGAVPPGYVLNLRGWVQRAGYAPVGY